MNRLLQTSAKLACRTPSRSLSSKPLEESVNEVTLIGRVGVEPRAGVFGGVGEAANESSETEPTKRYAMFKLATNRYAGKNEEGEAKFMTDWHSVRVYKESLVKLVEKAISKGDRLYLNGSIRYNVVKDQNGETKSYTTIVADEITILAKKQIKFESE